MIPESITFVVPGKPIGKVTHRIGRAKGSGRPVSYKPAKAAAAEARVRKYFYRVAGDDVVPWAGPVELHISARFRVPKSWPKWKQWLAQGRRGWAPRKPDADNFAKTYGDALTGVAYVDDKQIVALTVGKIYAASEEGVTVRLTFLPAMPATKRQWEAENAQATQG